MSRSRQFYVTRDMFKDYIGYTRPLTAHEWVNIRDDMKVAYLYCQFFNEITLAWFNTISDYANDEDGVSEVLKYLQKNVKIISNDLDRFTSAYIYTVAFNCLYALNRHDNQYKRRYEYEVNHEVHTDDMDIDLYDVAAASKSCDDNGDEIDGVKERFWAIIEAEGKDTVAVVAKLLGDRMDFCNPMKNGRYHKFTDRYYAKNISESREHEIIEKLKSLLAEYKDIFN